MWDSEDKEDKADKGEMGFESIKSHEDARRLSNGFWSSDENF